MNTPNVGNAAFQRQLTEGTIQSGNVPIVDLQLNYDVNFIKAETMFFTSEINSSIGNTTKTHSLKFWRVLSVILLATLASWPSSLSFPGCDGQNQTRTQFLSLTLKLDR